MAIQISVETLSPIPHNQIPVITTELLAQLYGTETNNIKVNYTRNAERFVCGKHYFKLEGAELREFKNKVTQSNLVAPRTKHLILWTERAQPATQKCSKPIRRGKCSKNSKTVISAKNNHQQHKTPPPKMMDSHY